MTLQNRIKNDVLIIGDGSLFPQGVTQLLNQHSEALIHRMEAVDDRVLINEIESNHHKVVVVAETAVREAKHVVSLIFSTPSLLEVVLRIIVVRYHDRTIDVFDQAGPRGNGAGYVRKRIIDGTSEDLVRFVSLM